MMITKKPLKRKSVLTLLSSRSILILIINRILIENLAILSTQNLCHKSVFHFVKKVVFASAAAAA